MSRIDWGLKTLLTETRLSNDSRILDHRNATMWHIWQTIAKGTLLGSGRSENHGKSRIFSMYNGTALLPHAFIKLREQRKIYAQLWKVNNCYAILSAFVQGLGIPQSRLLRRNRSKQLPRGCGTVCYNTETLLNLSIRGLKILNAWLVLLRFALLEGTFLYNILWLSSLSIAGWASPKS